MSAEGRPAPSPYHPLDHPVLAGLTGPHARFAERRGRVLGYRPEVSTWLALPEEPAARDWADATHLVGADGTATLAGTAVVPPDGWEITFQVDGVQLVDESVDAVYDEEAVVLGPADVPEMLDLVERTRPGPFRPRTVELGTYLGVRRDGELVAMAGERMRPPGWTEISAVCTAPGYRGQGLGGRLVLALAAGIKERGETPFIQAAVENESAVRLYEALGFRLRRRIPFLGIRVPEPSRVPATAGG
ncbi:GNAT family N-acetyltransferase [Streptomyces sp. NP-1717]|uniref:GNAT family N-acetyltransferase n=1 Tax=unclassified Streptomyces TaxID=2593676 RepID=UPI001F5CFBE6|nr:GNAT family N-acetyltransferase [Streptomyces sp. NP-1717]MCI3225331.1 GNAT family N-acetyltransferase [Streptomyces sp. NP-1717]WTA77251.1 GNAT family N-acetyltransferase [Streptomyces sp. NBC_00838]